MGGEKNSKHLTQSEMAVSLAKNLWFAKQKGRKNHLRTSKSKKKTQLPSTIPTSFSSQPSDSITNGS